jgi:drug/metabolite transporter (DMT)-like permease
MAALYRGLAGGRAALVAPTAGVVGAALPVVVGSVVEGLPGAADVVGMAIGIAGIWLVSQGGATSEARQKDRGLLMGIVAGVGFGGYFVLIAQVEAGPVFSPLVAAKLAAFVVALIAVAGQRRSLPALGDNPIAPIAGLLDAAGNVLYLLAAQLTRLDFAAVLASMYPASTVVLSRLILHERVSRRQWAGGVMCLAAVALIALP